MSHRPEIYGFYSITDDGKCEETTSSLRYFTKPELPIDLSVTRDDLKLRPCTSVREKFEQFLKYIVNHKSEFLTKSPTEAGVSQSDGTLIPCTQYITYGGVLRRIICSSNARRPWTLVATKYKGNIYLCEYTPPKEMEYPRMEDTPRHPLHWICNANLIFKHYCLSGHPNERPETSQPKKELVPILMTYPRKRNLFMSVVSETSRQAIASRLRGAAKQFFCVFKRNLLDRQFLFAAEIHGTDSRTSLDPKSPSEWQANQFVELKAIDIQYRAYEKSCFENVEAHKAWARCYLTGIENVHFGVLGNAKVKEIRSYTIGDLEKISRRNWKDRMEALEFFDYFLKRVESDLMDVNCPYTTVKYHQAVKAHFEPINYHHEEAAKLLTATVNEGRSKYSFLPEWYLQAIETASK